MQHFSKTLRGLALLATTLLALTACNDDELVPGGENGGSFPGHLTTHTIRITAGHDDSNSTRTTLQPNGQVTWDKGDEFRMVNEKTGTSDILQVIVSEKEAALAIPVTEWYTGLTGDINMKYSGINVEIGGKDVTSEILSTSTADNKYMFGALNAQEHYQYTTIGKEMKVKVKGSFTQGNQSAVIVQSSSRSDISPNNIGIVTLSGIQWKYNVDANWKKLNEKSALANGEVWGKKNVKYSWISPMDARMRLTSGYGKSTGEFEGKTLDNIINEGTRSVFPYQALESYQGGYLTINIPAEQTYAPNTFDHQANIMVGCVEKTENGYHVPFKNVMGVLKLSLMGNNENVHSITVTDRAGSSLWGTATISASEFEKNGINVSDIQGGTSTITLNCNGVKLTNEPTTFHIVLPAGALTEGFDVKVNVDDDAAAKFGTSSKKNVIAVNDVKEMPEMMLPTPISEFHLHNIAIHDYMAITPGPVFGQSSLVDYLSDDKYKNQDRPEYKVITWEGSTSDTYKVTLYDNTKKKDVYADREVKDTKYNLMNMVPEHEYTWTVKASDGTVVKTGKFRAVDQIRYVNIDDSWNYRDLGGWTGMNGRKVKYEWIYRGGSLNGVYQKGLTPNKVSAWDISRPEYHVFSEKGRQQIMDMGIHAELDLRYIYDENKSNDYSHCLALGDGTKDNIFYPVRDKYDYVWDFKRIATSPTLGDPMNKPGMVQDVAWIIDEVVNHGHPVAFHCRSGADRTGGLAVTILALLGVDPSDIARDYEITQFSSERNTIEKTSPLTFREKRADNNSEVSGYISKGFPSFGNDKGTNWQEKCYYYLNRSFENEKIAISSTDLNRFIEFMLGMPSGSYTAPKFATENQNTLEYIYNQPVKR